MKRFVWAMVLASVASTTVVAIIDYVFKSDVDWEQAHE